MVKASKLCTACKGQSRRLFSCDGVCGKPACGYVTPNPSSMKQHVARPRRGKKIACPHCHKRLHKGYLPRHIRARHPKYAQPKKTRRLSCPFPDDPHGWSFVKTKVRNCIVADMCRKLRWTLGDLAELEAQNCNAKRHALAKMVYGKWLSMGVLDDAGGCVPNGLKLRTHTLFQLSLDRIDNTRPHFIRNSLENLSFVVLGINNCASIVSRWGKKTSAELRARVVAPVAEAEIEQILKRETKAYVRGKNKNNVVYAACNNIYWKDEATRAQFENSRAFFQHGYGLLMEHRARCAISNILLSDHAQTDSLAFQPSLDAIVPAKGHVKGNLRWVCAFLNSTDCSKVNKYPIFNEPQSWTPALFRQYIGIR